MDDRDSPEWQLLRAAVEAIPFADTHEHLLDDATRRRGPGSHEFNPCSDAALLLFHYCRDDLVAAGMPPGDVREFFGTGRSPREKWRLVEPYWARMRHTGYGQAITASVQRLFGFDGLDGPAFEAISRRMQSPGYLRPGHTPRLMSAAGIESYQVESLECLFFREQEPNDPGRLQDISMAPLTISPRVPDLARATGITVRDLSDMERVLDEAFRRYAGQAVAVKNLAAYDRRLDFEPVTRDDAEAAFAAYLEGRGSDATNRLFQDYLTDRVLDLAATHHLPVKFHCGYYFGNGPMPIERVRENAADVARLAQRHPDVNFVLLHMGYPYEHDYAALAKRYPNVYVDLAWAWILNPERTTDFVVDFLSSAPHTKLLGFGGDHTIAEGVVGQAALARDGICDALMRLVTHHRLTQADAEQVARDIMHDNAHRLFPIERLLQRQRDLGDGLGLAG
jgi:predicted TIM-barrel fold metal-dependent hydrolase